ncbi:MAG: LamG-like jellyroll fold domain-containing protein, partial [Myxococcota bacterium]
MPTTRIDPISILGAATSTRTVQPGTITFSRTPAVTLNPDLFRFAQHTQPTLDLAIGATPPAHSDGRYSVTLQGAQVVEQRAHAPGFGELTHAIEFPGSARLESDDNLRGHTSFAVEMAIFPEASTEARQNLIEAQKPGFSLALRKTRVGYVLEAGLHVTHQPATADKTQWVSARSTKGIAIGKWQRVGVLFDGNALMVTINGEVAGRRVLRDGRLAAVRQGKDTWFLGTWVDGARNPFTGKIGGVKVWNSLPVQFMSAALAVAAAGVGAIASRHADLGGTRGLLKSPAEGEVDIQGGLKRRYQGGTLFWSSRTGAHEVHGSILNRYRSHISRLGFPTTDEKPGKKAGSRVSGFENGIVAWHSATGAHPVWGQAYMTYAANGAEAGWLGMPLGAVVVADVRHTPETRFENGRIYQRKVHEEAFEVHGSILARYLALGGRHGILGFPTSHESSVFNASGAVIGKVSHFEHGSIYWSSGRGAHEVVQPLQAAYQQQGGPSGTLGFPVSPPKRHGQKHRQGFVGGVLMKRSPSAKAQIVTSLTLRLGRTAQVGAIDDGIGFFEADKSAELFGKVNISASGVPKVQNKRVPNGHAGTTLTYSGAVPDVTIPATVDASFTVTIHLWDWDAASGDDKLGTYHRVFSADDLWELDASGSRIVDEPMTQGSGDASRNDLITQVSIAADKKEVDIADFRAQGWWKFVNKKTGTMSRGHYTEAFSDVEFVDDGWGAFIHLWDTIWYEAAFKGVATGGNCYGMCVEGHRALRNVSPFIQHIWERYDGFPDSNPTLTRQINIKQGWQLGAPALRWTIWNILNGDMWQPKQVFDDAKRAIDRDRGCTMSFFSLEEFVGHAIFAYDYVALRNPPGKVYGELLCADP